MKNRFASTMLVVSAALGACSGDLDPGAGDDPGEGTSTLQVNAHAIASPRFANARDSGDFDTVFSVAVQQNGSDVGTGTVSVTSRAGTFQLTYNNEQFGRWTGPLSGYDEVYVLDVESGADHARGVRVDGPDLHHFTAPALGATVNAADPLEIKWSCDDEAEDASLRAGDLQDIAMPDTRRYMLPAGALRSDPDRPREHSLRIRRENRVTPSGTLGGSEWSVEVVNEIEILVNPL